MKKKNVEVKHESYDARLLVDMLRAGDWDGEPSRRSLCASQPCSHARRREAKRETNLAREHVSLHPGEGSSFRCLSAPKTKRFQHLGKACPGKGRPTVGIRRKLPRRCGRRNWTGEKDGRVLGGHHGKNRCVGTSSWEPSPEQTAPPTLPQARASKTHGASHHPTEQLVANDLAAHRIDGAVMTDTISNQEAAGERGGRTARR